MVRFTIPIEPRTKKNSQRIVRCGNYHKIMQSKAYEQYEKDCAPFIPNYGIDEPVQVMGKFYMKTRRIVDLVNLEESLCDVLVKYGCIKDDNSRIIVSMDGSRVYHDKEHPRTEVVIKKYEK